MKNGRFQIRNEWNQDVPAETLLRKEVEENKRLHQKVGELESEILYLNSVIARRDQAISDFKRWQLGIAKMKINEWVSKAKNLTDCPEDLERFNVVKNAVKNISLFESMLRKLERAFRLYQENIGKLKEKGEQGNDRPE